MEVGPLARLIVAYASGHTDVQELVKDTLGKLNVPVGALFSTLGRTAARGLDAALAMGWLKEFFGELMERVKINEVVHVQRRTLGAEELAQGRRRRGPGRSAARLAGALDQDSRRQIDNYQLVVPTTWNGSPRDAKGQRSSFEAALIGTPVAKIDEPVEIIRTIHSFDPCLACAVHLYDPQGRHISQISFE
jgi:hydrogenase large subunit